MKNKYELTALPPIGNFETVPVLKKLAEAHRYLAELKGVSKTIPNQTILINTLSLQEAKDSSEIENIITTYDEMYQASVMGDLMNNPAAKEVYNYAKALRKGFDLVKQNDILTANFIIEIHTELEQSRTGFRKLPGTTLKNVQTGQIIYTPPQDVATIQNLMTNLETFINDDAMLDIDPLLKMAIIHFQFESIHPFYDGNGRTGRIINVLYLVLKKLLDLPVLYLSRHIIRTKRDYYRLLQQVRETGAWDEWLLYMLDAVQFTAQDTIVLIEQIRGLMLDYKHRIRAELPKIYSQELLNNLFRHPYTKIQLVEQELHVTRKTAAKYLDALVDHGFLKMEQIGRTKYFVNRPLFELFVTHGDMGR